MHVGLRAPPPLNSPSTHLHSPSNSVILLLLHNCPQLVFALLGASNRGATVTTVTTATLLHSGGGGQTSVQLRGFASVLLCSRAQVTNHKKALFHNIEQVSSFVQHHLSNFIGIHLQPSGSHGGSLLSISPPTKAPLAKTSTSVQLGDTAVKGKSAAPVSKEELGRATWTFLHTLAAQYPDNPTRQQKKDVKELVQILSRIYPCRDCADHFKEILRVNPVQTGSHAEFSQWLCHVHNVVNRSLGKPIFPCERIDARWGKLDCEQNACDIIGSTSIFGKIW